MNSRAMALLHPFLFCVAPVLLLAAHNYDQIRLDLLVVPLAISLAGALLLLGVGRLLTANWLKASLLATMAIAAFFSYGHLHTAIASLHLLAKTRYVHYILAPAYPVLFVAGSWFVLRTKRNLEGVCRTLTILGTAICGIATFQLAMHYRSYNPSESLVAQGDAAAEFARLEEIARGQASRQDLPDIYYIILDGYARADVLRKCHGFDNSSFLAGLEQRGFFVAERSTSNYTMTYLSLASSLNMRYVNEDVEPYGTDNMSRAPIYKLMWNHRVGRLLQAAGYQYVHFKTNWTGTEKSDIADLAMPNTLPEFHMVLASTTILKPLLSLGLIPRLSGPTAGRLYRYIFDSIEQVPTFTEAPRFVFAHLICPHPPALIDAEGNILDRPDDVGREFGDPAQWHDIEGYLGQVQYCNRRVLELVDTLVASSSTPPIIIVQADHGSCATYDVDRPIYEQPEFLEERTAILNAYLVPEEIRERLNPAITPVNTFRIVLSDVLELDLPLLEPRIYFSWYRQPHNFVDVTERVRPDEAAVQQ